MSRGVPIVLLSDVPTVQSSQTTLDVLRELFIVKGVPIELLSDVPTVQRSQITVEVLQELFVVKGRSD